MKGNKSIKKADEEVLRYGRPHDGENYEERKKLIDEALERDARKFYPIKGDPIGRVVQRDRKKGQKGNTFVVEAHAYKLIVDIPSKIPEAYMHKGLLFIWNGIRNRYEYVNVDGFVVGMSKDQLDADKRYKLIRCPVKKRQRIEYSQVNPVFGGSVLTAPKELVKLAMKQDKALGVKRNKKDYEKAVKA
jgi:hypothetical protein